MPMKTRRKYYPPDWDDMRKQRFAEVGYCCEDCGVQDCTVVANPNKKHPLFPDGQPYMVHLNLSHKSEYLTWDRGAETAVLCNACHGRFDAKNRRKDVGKKQTSIGWVRVRVLHAGRWVLAADPWSYNELYRVVSALPVGAEFELIFEMVMQSVGLGRYIKRASGVTVLYEEGIGTDFGWVLEGIPSGA
ncbi:MAG TPA: hypothetical protein VF458_06390 [Ktedonobacteraceae bacterium]